ncbi:MAG TPA: hypothetical protein VJ951_15100 [Bacteroidales bacterium]|nr:hypothetical protein [Bacteroidales bacterium]
MVNENIGETLKKYVAHLVEPVSVYINWAAYDELSDNIRLDHDIAMRQFHELVRLKENGVKFDYYLMDAFWFSKNGGYREWRKESWPDGPEEWYKLCDQHGIKPGLWISTNLRVAGEEYWFLDSIPEWDDSLSVDGRSFCLFEGGYLPHLMETLKMHARNGIKMFKFDFADFTSVTPSGAKKYAPYEAYILNKNALLNAISEFRAEFPDVLFLAYNGYGGYYLDTTTPFVECVDPQWLMAFDSLYCGDPRLADSPCMNFWRSKDIYSDHMVKQYHDSNIPLKRIDNTAFMIGKTGTCYYREKKAWKGMLLLSLARGGWMNTYYGNLDLLDEKDARFFAKAQQLYLPFQRSNSIKLTGGIPGKGEDYGYLAYDKEGMLLLLVNPSQEYLEIDLSNHQSNADRPKKNILFNDTGFKPYFKGNKLKLGPEQLVLIGLGKYSNENYHLGEEKDVKIPVAMKQVDVDFKKKSNNSLQGQFDVTKPGLYRVIFQQFLPNGMPCRLSGGGYPNGTPIDKLEILSVQVENTSIPIAIKYDKPLWSGLSWAVAEFELNNNHKGASCHVEYNVKNQAVELIIIGKLYSVNY